MQLYVAHYNELDSEKEKISRLIVPIIAPTIPLPPSSNPNALICVLLAPRILVALINGDQNKKTVVKPQ